MRFSEQEIVRMPPPGIGEESLLWLNPVRTNFVFEASQRIVRLPANTELVVQPGRNKCWKMLSASF